jgi:hypothetical protein
MSMITVNFIPSIKTDLWGNYEAWNDGSIWKRSLNISKMSHERVRRTHFGESPFDDKTEASLLKEIEKIFQKNSTTLSLNDHNLTKPAEVNKLKQAETSSIEQDSDVEYPKHCGVLRFDKNEAFPHHLYLFAVSENINFLLAIISRLKAASEIRYLQIEATFTFTKSQEKWIESKILTDNFCLKDLGDIPVTDYKINTFPSNANINIIL